MSEETGFEYELMVRRAVDEIERCLDDPPGMHELAAGAFVSPYHFHRIFHALVGESARELARRLRLERAAHRLRDTRATVAQIAAEAGYLTPDAFAKAFHTMFDAAPSAFRAAGGQCLGIRTENGVHYVNGGYTVFHPIHRGGPDMKVEPVELTRQRVAAVSHTGPYWQIGKAFGGLAARAESLGLPAGPHVAVFYDDQETVPETELRSIAGRIVADETDIGDLEEVWLPAGRFLRAEYMGHPSGLPRAWEAVYGRHIPEGGYRLREEICFEIYVIGHEAASPELMQTDLYAPIA